MSEWQPIETAPLAEMVWLWAPLWRHPFPGQRNGDHGACYVDTCETEARGWQTYATHWMPMPALPEGYEHRVGEYYADYTLPTQEQLRQPLPPQEPPAS